MTAFDNRPTTNTSMYEILREGGSIYSTQIVTGFKSLRFLPELEQEFRQHYFEKNPGQIRRALPLAVILTLLFALSDFQRLPHDTYIEVLLIRCCQFVALALLAAVVYGNIRKLLEPAVAMALIVFGVSTPIIIGTISIEGYYAPINAQLLILMFCYFLSGLRFIPALFVALVISLAYPASQLLYSTPLPNLTFNCHTLLAFNVLGVAGAYFLEYAMRENFLARQLLQEMALYDGLTGLLNRHAFGLDLEKVVLQAKRDKVGIAVAMADVDHFKHFNDAFGHVQGDKCLQDIARALLTSVKRPLDKAGRYGGEEFILVWYDCSEQYARELGEAARLAVDALKIAHSPASDQASVSISIGVCARAAADISDSGDLIKAADRALYRAKNAGRNRVVLDSDPSAH